MKMGGLGAADMAPQRSKGLLKEKLELVKVKTKDGRSRVTLKPIEDQLTFDKGFYVFIRALQLLRAHNQGVVLVGLGGASGSGKTAFSAKVKDFMPNIAVISMDNYNDGSKVVDSNFDDPRLTDYDLLLTNLSDLQQGKAAEIPIYDFKSSQRVGFNTLEVPESRVVIIEGIYALSERLKPLLDLRVSITGGVHFDLVKRVLRDISRSGQGPEEIIQQITDTVYPMYKAFIEPDLKAAQLKIHNSFNPFTGFMNATYILKAPRAGSLTQQAVVAVLGEGAATKTEAEMCDIHLLPPNEDPETCASWLRMRNRDGRYTLMFEEWVTEGDFIISPRIQFEVSVRVLGGLMALGYEIGTVMRRTSTLMTSQSGDLTVKFDDVEHLGKFVQVQGKDRDRVAAVAKALQLGDYIPRSYIEQVQLSKLTNDFQTLTDDMRKRFSVDGRSVLDDIYGSSPPFGSLLSPLKGSGLLGSRGGGAAGGAGRGGVGRYPLTRHLSGSAAAAAAAGAGAAAGPGGGGGGGYPPPFPGGEFGSPGRDLSLLSTSAPVRGSSPISINPSGRAKGVPGGGAAAGSSGTAAGSGGGGSSSLGAPRGSPPVAAAAASPSSSVAAAAGSTVAPSSIVSSDGNASMPGSVDSASLVGAATLAGLNAAAGGSSGVGGGQQQQQQRGVAAGSGGGGGSSGGSNGFAGRGNGLLGQQLRNSSRAGSNSSLSGLADGPSAAAAAAEQQQHSRLSVTGLLCGTDGAAAAAVLGSGAGTDSSASLALLRRLQEEMAVVAEGFKRHSGMQLHLDALTHQYKHLNESMAALSAATKSLAACVQQLQEQQQQQLGGSSNGVQGNWQQQQQQQRGLGQGLTGGVGGVQGQDVLLLGAGAVAGGVLAAAAALLLGRSRG